MVREFECRKSKRRWAVAGSRTSPCDCPGPDERLRSCDRQTSEVVAVLDRWAVGRRSGISSAAPTEIGIRGPTARPLVRVRTHLSLLQSRSQERLEVLCRFPALVRLDARLQAVHVGMAGLEGWRRQCGSDDALSLLHVPATPKEVLDARVLQRQDCEHSRADEKQRAGGRSRCGEQVFERGGFV